MVSKKDWKTWLRTTMLIALAAFVALGFTFVTVDTAAADSIPCAAPAWVTEDSHIPVDTVDVVCALTSSTSKGLNTRFSAASTVNVDSGAYFESYLAALEQAERDLAASFGSTSGFDPNSFDYLDDLALSMKKGPEVTVSSTSGFDPNSFDYLDDLALSMKKEPKVTVIPTMDAYELAIREEHWR